MGMDSYLELFTTVYGWTIANLLYSILLDTGIVFIPLIITIVTVWLEAHVEGPEEGAVERMIRRMEVELYTALFVISVCFVPTPFTTLDKAYLTFKPDSTVVNPTPATVTGANSGSTFDAAFGAGTGAAGAGVPVPLWWYTVMGLSSGVNSAVRAGVSNNFLGLRQAEELARLATIEDPALRGEAQMFRNQCFVPAHAKFHSPDTPHSAIAAAFDPFANRSERQVDHPDHWLGMLLLHLVSEGGHDLVELTIGHGIAFASRAKDVQVLRPVSQRRSHSVTKDRVGKLPGRVPRDAAGRHDATGVTLHEVPHFCSHVAATPRPSRRPFEPLWVAHRQRSLGCAHLRGRRS